MRKNVIVAGACTFALLVVAVLVLKGGRRRPFAVTVGDDSISEEATPRAPFPVGTGAPSRAATAAQAGPQPQAPPALPAPTSPTAGATSPNAVFGGPGAGSPAQQALATYKLWARYPPTSRPIAEQPDQLRPHVLLPTVRPLDPNRPDKVTLRQEQDRLYLVPGEAAVVTLAAAVAGSPATVVIDKAKLARFEGTPPTLSAPIASVIFRDDGAPPDAIANDGVLSAAVIPPVATLVGYAGDLRLTVGVRVNGEQGEVSFPFVYTGEPPARFTGAAREAVEDGSLALYVGVEIHRAGRYLIVGRLYDAGDRPVALLQQNDIVDTTAREVRLLAFGKLLRDAGAVSPFSLRDVQGWRMVEGGYPDRELLEMWAGPYKTAAYATEAFSDREWDSPSKRNRLAGLQQIANGPP
jgi:hypothetical protein